MALDREKLVTQLSDYPYQAATGFAPPGGRGAPDYKAAGVAALSFKPDEARKLLAQVYPDLASMPPLTLTIVKNQTLADGIYPLAKKIVVVMDNLNTHSSASFYETFEPQEARRLAERFEFHYTPKHGSWLNMAEIELGVLIRQCLSRRIPDKTILENEVNSWQTERNAKVAKVDWRFTTADACIKLKHLYPLIYV